MTEHLQLFGQAVEITVLLGIFFRLGGIGATLKHHEERLVKLERKHAT